MAKNDIGGVWRTIGGRRVFIKDGQDLASAMKESGKFKTKKQKREEDLEKYNKLSQEERIEKYQSGKKWNDWSDDDETMSIDDYKKEYGNDVDRLKRELAQSERFLDEDSEGYKEAKKNIENGYKYLDQLEKEKEPTTYFEGKKDIEDEVRQIYAEEGLMATSERNLKYISEKYGIPKTQAKAFIEDTAKRFDEENENYNKKKSEINKTYTQKQLDNVWKTQDATEVYNYLTESEKRKLAQAHDDASFGNQSAKDYIKKMDNEVAQRYLENNAPINKKLNEKYGFNENDAYKKAFEKYKKEHPNSKITLKKFIKNAEGK